MRVLSDRFGAARSPRLAHAVFRPHSTRWFGRAAEGTDRDRRTLLDRSASMTSQLHLKLRRRPKPGAKLPRECPDGKAVWNLPPKLEDPVRPDEGSQKGGLCRTARKMTTYRAFLCAERGAVTNYRMNCSAARPTPRCISSNSMKRAKALRIGGPIILLQLATGLLLVRRQRAKRAAALIRGLEFGGRHRRARALLIHTHRTRPCAYRSGPDKFWRAPGGACSFDDVQRPLE